MARKKVPRTLEFDMVGMQHRLTMSTRRMLRGHVAEAPVICMLEREPGNPADENALMVKVHDVDSPYDKMHIGYVPRKVAAEMSPRIDSGEIVVTVAYLVDVMPEDGEGGLQVRIKTAG